MNILSSLSTYLRKNAEFTKESAPDGYCPNCWGSQEYGGKFYEAVKSYKSDINLTDPKSGWVQDYANKNLLGIQLQKKDDDLVCQNCKLTYRPSSY